MQRPNILSIFTNRPKSIAAIILLALSAILFNTYDTEINKWAFQYKFHAENETTRLGEIFQLCRLFGKADVLILLAMLLGLAGKRRMGISIILSLLFVLVTVQPLKFAVGRERPDKTSHRSFPSGDTATAFVMPEVTATNPILTTLSVIAATGVGTSRVFYQRHYPSDVLIGAAFGILCGILGCFCSKRLRWLPSRKIILYILAVFTGYLALAAILDLHHRHMVQFVAWYGPAILLIILYPYLRIAKYNLQSENKAGKLLLSLSYAMCIAGLLLLIVPWFLTAPSLRPPSVSLGLFLITLFYYLRKSLINSRREAAYATLRSAAIISILWGVGYAAGIL